MTRLEKTVRQARSRLTLNAWLARLCVSLTVAAAGSALLTLVVRLFGWTVPLGVIAPALAAAALIFSVIWASAARVSVTEAAAALDQAAGLSERLSSGLYCRDADDPFQQAVFADAEERSAGLSVRRHIRLRRPSQWPGTLLAIALAAATFLVPQGWLGKAQAKREEQVVEAQRVSAVVKKRTEEIKQIARTNPELKEIAEDLDKVGQAPDGRPQKPADIRQDALKKLDRLADALKEQLATDRIENAQEFKKMLRGLQPIEQHNTPLDKLSQSLANGDFKEAKEQVQAAQKQLEELAKSNNDPKKVEDLQKQLEELSKKLESLSKDDKLSEKLQQLGIKKEDVEQMLKNPTPQDIDKLKQMLEKQGLTQQQISEITKKLQQSKGAEKLSQQLAQACKQAAQSAGQGQTGQAASGLKEAAGQLSDLEKLEQEMEQIDSMASNIKDARDDLSNPCSKCNGTGQCNGGKCPSCNGQGAPNGMGKNMGRGRGGIAQYEDTKASFVKQRQKVHSHPGSIIGQYLVDGEQYKGEISPSVQEVVTASERDAADAIDRARIPRQYHDAVRNYFSDIQEELTGKHKPAEPPAEHDDSAESSPHDE